MTRVNTLSVLAVAFAAVVLLAVSAVLAQQDPSLRAERELNQAYRQSFAPPDEANAEVERELQDLIDKVNAISLPESAPTRGKTTAPQHPTTKQTDAEKQTDAAERSDASEAEADGADQTDETDGENEAFGPPEAKFVPPPLLKSLVAQSPENMPDPQRLADALFASGHHEQAYALYARELETAEDPSDQAWLVYQMGNCKVESDHAAAAALYRRVMAEFPQTPWGGLAQANLELLKWMDENKPREFLRELQAEFGDVKTPTGPDEE
jgi:tetratricopeptide (TPR) repeat protein